MTGLSTTFTFDGAGGEIAVVRSRFTKRDGTAPIGFYCHGNAGTAESGMVPWNAGQFQLVRTLAQAGYIMVLPTMGGSLWANDTALGFIDSAILTAQAAPFYGRTGKVLMTGISMGGLTALAYAGNNPTKVAAVITAEPVTDLNSVKPTFPGVDAAYGGNYNDAAYGATHNPIRMAEASKFASMPIRMWYGTTDTIATPTLVNALDTAIKAKANPMVTTTSLPGDHSENTTILVPPVDVATFAQRYLPVG